MRAYPRLRSIVFSMGVCLGALAAEARETVDELRAKADKGDAVAQNELGCIFENGEGVRVDFDAAAKWYRRAAEQNHAMAQGNLGYLYLVGKGVPKDKAVAIQWWRKSAAGGCGGSMFNLGLVHQNGDGVEKDLAQAAKWYRSAALLGESSAMANLGLMHEKGEGVEKDLIKAYAYYKVAALEYGDVDGKRRLALLLKAHSVDVLSKGNPAAAALTAEIAAAKKAAK